MDWRQQRDNTNIRYLLQVAAAAGVSADACLENTGLQQERLAEGSGYQLWQELAAIRNLVAHRPAPGLGMQMGDCYHLTCLGLLGYAMLSSPNLWEAIRISSRFRSLSLAICPVTLAASEEGIWMCLDSSVLPEDARDLVVGRGLTAWLRLFGELLQRPFMPVQISLSSSEPMLASRYRDYFSCPILLEQPHDDSIARVLT